MRPLAPEQGGLARDELRAECGLSVAPIPGIEMIVQERLLREGGKVCIFLVPITLFSEGSQASTDGSLRAHPFAVVRTKPWLHNLCAKDGLI